MLPRDIALHSPPLPPSGQLPPHLVRNPRAHAAPPVPAHDKKFRHVVAARLGSGFDQRQSPQISVYPDQKWMPRRLAPIEGKMRVLESAVDARIHIDQVAEIVDIKLKQVGNDRLLLARGGDKLDLRRGLLAHGSDKASSVSYQNSAAQTLAFAPETVLACTHSDSRTIQLRDRQ